MVQEPQDAAPSDETEIDDELDDLDAAEASEVTGGVVEHKDVNDKGLFN